MIRKFFTLGSFLVALCASLFAVGTTASAAPAPTAPDPDVFYAAPADIADHAPGDILASRRADAWMYPNTDIWQLKYRSTNSAGAPVAAVTTVLMPRGKGAGTPLVSYQAVINALGVKCAPSHGLSRTRSVKRRACTSVWSPAVGRLRCRITSARPEPTEPRSTKVV